MTLFTKYPANRCTPETAYIVTELNAKIRSGAITLVSVPCACCGADRPELLFTNDRYGVEQNTVMCRDCGFIYGEPRMSPEALGYFYGSDIYRALYHPIERYFSKFMAAQRYEPTPFDPFQAYDAFAFVDFLRETGIEYDTVCEIGAAGGANLVPFAKLGKKVYGIEISPGMVEFAKNHGLNVELVGLDDLSGDYDLFILQHVLEHTFDPVAFLCKLAQKNARCVFIGVPSIITLMPSVQSAHNFYFSLDTLRAVCAKAGYCCRHVDYFRGNNYIVGYFEHLGTEGKNGVEFQYDARGEIRAARRIVRNFKIRRFAIDVREWIKSRVDT